ncbi:L-ribulose 5-phosphate 4-epimerase [Acidothermus cellulolyticus 11B]|uniref:L-ribulose-5-phosphate 4-epimerase n=1 Tax=Acidothermus cellulolyticus (strain ATCC 43068 / DSM 8971 / 11B) TaxID=351607 RepID=A0LT85_ACIC1|nr:L-ribulose-5-phosphate 4-epimerase [Acidothermus cellulolyticus]ABK52645.1 L-ribulose 5-phosphate 4-epimerase [Acidothermus cellulolyticus 11B]
MTIASSDVIAQLRRELLILHRKLVTWGLVVWTAGNVSARIPGEPLMLIKPSGVDYDLLREESFVVCDFSGGRVEGSLTPSSDARSHGYIYAHMPHVGGVVHTHSPYATAWAARGEPIPCILTAMADEFGGPIPVGPFAPIGDERIGRGVVETLRTSRSPAVLMKNHGVFAVGATAEAAVKAAVMCEDAARTVYLARNLGEVEPLPAHDIDALHRRYQTAYGQR